MVACRNERTDEARALSFQCLMRCPLFLRKRVVFASFLSLNQRVQQELKGTQARAETLTDFVCGLLKSGKSYSRI